MVVISLASYWEFKKHFDYHFSTFMYAEKFNVWHTPVCVLNIILNHVSLDYDYRGNEEASWLSLI